MEFSIDITIINNLVMTITIIIIIYNKLIISKKLKVKTGGQMVTMEDGIMEIQEVQRNLMSSGSMAMIQTRETEMLLIRKLNIHSCHHGIKKTTSLPLIHIAMLNLVLILMELAILKSKLDSSTIFKIIINIIIILILRSLRKINVSRICELNRFDNVIILII